MRCALGEADPVEELAGAAARCAIAAQFQRQHDVLQSGQAVDELEGLEHEADAAGAHQRPGFFVQRRDAVAVQPDVARGRQVQAGENAEQGGLAGTGFADDGHLVAGGDVQAHVVQNRQRAFGGGYALDQTSGAQYGC